MDVVLISERKSINFLSARTRVAAQGSYARFTNDHFTEILFLPIVITFEKSVHWDPKDGSSRMSGSSTRSAAFRGLLYTPNVFTSPSLPRVSIRDLQRCLPEDLLIHRPNRYKGMVSSPRLLVLHRLTLETDASRFSRCVTAQYAQSRSKTGTCLAHIICDGTPCFLHLFLIWIPGQLFISLTPLRPNDSVTDCGHDQPNSWPPH